MLPLSELSKCGAGLGERANARARKGQDFPEAAPCQGSEIQPCLPHLSRVSVSQLGPRGTWYTGMAVGAPEMSLDTPERNLVFV